jgi:hypothetical protein
VLIESLPPVFRDRVWQTGPNMLIQRRCVGNTTKGLDRKLFLIGLAEMGKGNIARGSHG